MYKKDFKTRELERGLFISNDFGQWHYLENGNNESLNVIEKDTKLFSILEKKGLIGSCDNKIVIEDLKNKWKSPVSNKSGQLVIIHLTQRCNLTCSYCHSSAISVQAKGRDLVLEKAKEICGFIKDIDKKSITIAFQGGEPSLEIDLIQYICNELTETFLSEKRSVKFGITTNGTNHSARFVDLIKKYEISTTISFDGPKIIHDKYRISSDGKGSFDDAMKFKEILSTEIKGSNVGSIMVLTRDSIGQIESIVDQYLSFGKSIFKLKPITRLGHAKSKRSWDDKGLEFEEYWDAYLKSVELLKSYYYEGRHIAMEHDMFFFIMKLFEGKNIGDVDTRNPCGIIDGVISIDVDGKIYACHEGKRIKDFHLGSTESAPDIIFNSEKSNKLRADSSLSNISECKECAYEAFCTPCPAHNHQSYKSTKTIPFESWECRKTISICDYVLNDFENNSQYYLDVWKLNKLNDQVETIL